MWYSVKMWYRTVVQGYNKPEGQFNLILQKLHGPFQFLDIQGLEGLDNHVGNNFAENN